MENLFFLYMVYQGTAFLQDNTMLGYKKPPDNKKQTCLAPKWPVSREESNSYSKTYLHGFYSTKKSTELDLWNSKSTPQLYSTNYLGNFTSLKIGPCPVHKNLRVYTIKRISKHTGQICGLNNKIAQLSKQLKR